MSGQVYAVASGKGGVGKTTTVVNLGVALRSNDQSVAMVDVDLGMPNLATLLGIEGEPTIHDVLADDATVEDVLIEEADGFGVVPGTRDLSSYADSDPSNLGSVIETLRDRYDYVLLDTGAGLSYEDVLPLGLVDGIVLVTSPDPAATGDTKRTTQIADLIDGQIRGVVITHAGPDTDAQAIAADLGTDLLGVIPDDPAVKESTAAGRPLEAFAPDSAAAEAYRRLGEAVIDESVEPSADPKAVAEDGAEESTGSADAPVDEPADETEAVGSPGEDAPPAAGGDAAADAPESAPTGDDLDATVDPTEVDPLAPDQDPVEGETAAAAGAEPDSPHADDAVTDGDAPPAPDDPDDEGPPAAGADASDADEEAPPDDDTDAGDDENGGFLGRLTRRFR